MYDVLIIGAGILGCFAARSLSRYNLNIAVLEKHEDVCKEISRANTGIIYQGYDQHPGSLKATMCRRASEQFPKLCEELDVPYRRTGLLMVSFGPNADRILERKLSHAVESQIPHVSLIGPDKLYELEPNLCPGARGALYAESTYTVNPWELGIAAFENASANGVEFHFNEKVHTIQREDGAFTIKTENGSWQAKRVLCCGGFQADHLWEMAGKPQVRILPQAADYIVFDTYSDGLVRHVLSVEPEEKGEGITLVPTVDGNLLLGPTRRDVRRPAAGATNGEALLELITRAKTVIPSLPADMIIRNFGAARPNPYYLNEDGTLSGKSLKDFVILEQEGFFALVGVKTPGITCASELGIYVTQRILNSFPGKIPFNPDYNPKRKGIPKIVKTLDEVLTPGSKTGVLKRRPGNESSKEPQDTLLPEDYYEIVCRCRHVSKGEVLEAIRRGAKTVDGVKRRTGAGMGRCQGGFCMEKVMHLLAENQGGDIYSITKDGGESQIVFPKQNTELKIRENKKE